MTPWIVRLVERSAHPHELVGVFVAPCLRHLIELVDECCPPDDCEAAELPAGGVFLDSRAARLPADPHAERPACLFHDSSVTDGWLRSFYSDEPEWIALGDLLAGDDR